ncbi:hypothetical protein [Rhizobium chutanense]|nr:hypothetical protein [Rhizobium chutanense]
MRQIGTCRANGGALLAHAGEVKLSPVEQFYFDASLHAQKRNPEMTKMPLTVLLISAVSVAFVSPGWADTLPLSKIDRKTEAAIRRSNAKQNVRCFDYILKDFLERKIRKADIYVTFNDPAIDGIGIGIAETDENYSCEAGELRSWEQGSYQVAKKFK